MAKRRTFALGQGQCQRGSHNNRRPISFTKRLGFAPIVALSSAAVFGATLFGDRLPELLTSAVQASRNLGRERAPQLGDYFSGCDDARAAGTAPIYRDEPGYRTEMDGDSDGVACEPYRG